MEKVLLSAKSEKGSLKFDIRLVQKQKLGMSTYSGRMSAYSERVSAINERMSAYSERMWRYNDQMSACNGQMPGLGGGMSSSNNPLSYHELHKKQ